MELGKHAARIIDYGLGKTKAGEVSVYIRFKIGSEEPLWFGSPFKKDGNPNDMCLQQLAEAGFDFEARTINDLYHGLTSGCLITDEDINVMVADRVQGDGQTKRQIDFIGERGMPKISAEEAKALLDEQRLASLKGAGTKFRSRKKKDKPEDIVPF